MLGKKITYVVFAIFVLSTAFSLLSIFLLVCFGRNPLAERIALYSLVAMEISTPPAIVAALRRL